ncbi:hypothetical protein [Streptomyces sp. NPDC023588]|uniref:hypothetical protein n=1 Tax=Streptomyces sp. NPDC023588 TaxID=3154907 RepID=UPI003406A411
MTGTRAQDTVPQLFNGPPAAGNPSAASLHAAADTLVIRGQLLIWTDKHEGDHDFDEVVGVGAEEGQVLGEAQDAADADQGPARRGETTAGGSSRASWPQAPAMERHSEHRRVQVLATLAANPHTRAPPSRTS